MKFGIYFTTNAAEGGIGVTAAQNVADLVAAGIDYVKHDGYGLDITNPDFTDMRDALLSCGRPIVYSIHARDWPDVPDIANMWRTGPDIQATWSDIMNDYNNNIFHLPAAGPGHWPDPDMLEVGIGNLTDNENRAHFSMWCMMASPLICAYDFAFKSEQYTEGGEQPPPALEITKIVEVLGNTELIAVDQDALGEPAARLKGEGAKEVWAKNLHDGTRAVAFFNRTSGGTDISVSKAELGWGSESTIYVRDLWVHENAGEFTDAFTKNVGVHAAEVFLMSTNPITGPVEILKKMERLDSWLQRNGHPGVLPKSTILKVMQGNTGALRMFDMRGRFIAADPRLVSPHTFIVRDISNPSMNAKIAWPGK